VDLRAVERNGAHLEASHLARQRQHLHEHPLDLLEKPPPKRRDRIVVGMIVRRDESGTPPNRKSPASSFRLENTPVA